MSFGTLILSTVNGTKDRTYTAASHWAARKSSEVTFWIALESFRPQLPGLDPIWVMSDLQAPGIEMKLGNCRPSANPNARKTISCGSYIIASPHPEMQSDHLSDGELREWPKIGIAKHPSAYLLVRVFGIILASSIGGHTTATADRLWSPAEAMLE